MKNQLKLLIGLTTLLALPFFVMGQETQTPKTDTEARQSLIEISTSLKNLNQDAKNVEGDVRLEIKNAIDASIIYIRNTQEAENQRVTEAYEFQREIDDTRQEVFESLRQTFRESAPTDPQKVEKVRSAVDSAMTDIETDLETFSDVEVDLSEYRERINGILNSFTEKVARNQAIIQERDGALLDADSDDDGLSDYDELYIYETDPNNANTSGGIRNDAEKVLAGINPTSETEEPIDYADPREDTEAAISDFYTVDEVQKVDGRVQIRGRALPNSMVTVYVFSTPVIVTMKTDNRGEWTYTLDKELEDGQHEIYVATVNNAGRIVARSNSVPFVNTAQAASLGSFASIGQTPEQGTGNFYQDNFILIVVVIVLIGILVTMSLFGKKPKAGEGLTARKNPVQEYADKKAAEKAAVAEAQTQTEVAGESNSDEIAQ